MVLSNGHQSITQETTIPTEHEHLFTEPEAESKQTYDFRKALQRKILRQIEGNYSQYQKIDRRINELELSKHNEKDKMQLERITEELDRMRSIHDSRGSTRDYHDNSKIAEAYFKWERDNVYYKK